MSQQEELEREVIIEILKHFRRASNLLEDLVGWRGVLRKSLERNRLGSHSDMVLDADNLISLTFKLEEALLALSNPKNGFDLIRQYRNDQLIIPHSAQKYHKWRKDKITISENWVSDNNYLNFERESEFFNDHPELIKQQIYAIRN